ncbi:ABC transporter permease [Brachybacterium fresconis]|uniref:Peptide/nickel transport system permease protein n=1 Tax=Brachybacterium fresconis TaxID=173363 RepID=A0ABS4YHX1_9MICO|nr:ABC transporter permease [Brachybacterium fresconis]MBP2408366.1 peptide/nickel transport system permease protein [Brachybacterium fresconis]
MATAAADPSVSDPPAADSSAAQSSVRSGPRVPPVLRRLAAQVGSSLLLLWAVATIVFFLQHLVPGDPALAILGGASANPPEATVQAVREQYGFDDPLLVQYAAFLGGLVQLDLGESYTMKEPVLDVIGAQILPTLQLTAAALVVAWVLALASTLITAGRPGAIGRIGSALEVVLAALPPFWLGVLLLVVFAVVLGWLPVVDGGPLGMILPSLTLGIPLGGFLAQVTRDEFEAAQRQPFVLSALSRGAGPGDVRWRHVLRHAALPGIALSGWGLGSLISGAVVVEVIFSRQGIGQVLVAAVTAQDLPLVVGVTLVVALVYVVANVLTDLAYVAVDPRLRSSIGATS